MKNLSNFHQRVRALVGLSPVGCYGKNCGCQPGNIFECETCGYLRPWCRGADDGMPDSCDFCWGTAQRMQQAVGIEGDVEVVRGKE
ncbi:hypothetical protein DXZ20_04575 [Leptolyngbyaceae cyanobacterium CCMR0081]|uniref:Uncharacterized protein n=1 Tax=Adonisia turfae CCMR0081 TaxID=2292702 RepID=A0A6M0RFF5_9CYAN|nr:hypothetical protein [Adonisia turfae CCMR0081]